MIKLVPKLMTVLELFASGEEFSFSEVVEQTGLTKSSTSHILDALCAGGTLIKVRYGHYRRGERLTRLAGGGSLWTELNLIADRCAGNVMGRLNELTVVGLRFQSRRLTLTKLKPAKKLQVDQGGDGRHYQADWYGTANGRVLLAFAPDEIIQDVVRHDSLPLKSVWREASTLPKLMAQLEQIRRERHVVMMVDSDIKAIGVPARDASGEPVFSIATAFPVFSCRKSDTEILECLNFAAEAMEKELEIRGISAADLQLKNNRLNNINNTKG